MRQLIALGLLLPLMSAQAGVYKCKDASGKIHYQDTACSTGTKAANFNSSARNITGIAAQPHQEEEQEYFDGEIQESVELAPSKAAPDRRYDPSKDSVARAGYQRERDRLDSALGRTPVDKMRRHGEPAPRGETERQTLERQRRNLEALENARLNGVAFVPESAPAIAATPRSQSPRPERSYDPSTNRWCWNYGNGAPLQCAP